MVDTRPLLFVTVTNGAGLLIVGGFISLIALMIAFCVSKEQSVELSFFFGAISASDISRI
jgi:uncharacterized integral membrane protein